MRAIVLWLLDWLRQNLDTDLKKRLDDYKAERARVQAEFTREMARLEDDANMLALLKEKRSEVRDQISVAETELERLKKELKQIDEESNQVTDGVGGDSFHADLTPRRPGADRGD